jgi:hypothetical protein
MTRQAGAFGARSGAPITVHQASVRHKPRVLTRAVSLPCASVVSAYETSASPEGEKTRASCAATHSGTQYNPELTDPLTLSRTTSQVSDGACRIKPRLVEGAVESMACCHEAQTSDHNSVALESEPSAQPKRSARQSTDSTMPDNDLCVTADVNASSQ